MSENNITEALNLLLKPLGVTARLFLIDYKNERGIDCFVEMYPPPKCNEKLFVEVLLEDFAAQGRKVTAVHEILDGYSHKQIESLTETNPSEAMRHIKRLYWID